MKELLFINLFVLITCYNITIHQEDVNIDKTLYTCFKPYRNPYQKQDNISDLKGRWKLEKIVRSWTTNIPGKADYYLNITDTLIWYNMEINTCTVYDFKITDSTIEYKAAYCTQKCCDERIDNLGYFLKYNGKYKIKDSLLTIENEKGTSYLIRQKNEAELLRLKNK
jgi:hypothetical protein